jgi:hypothetical protein
VVDDGSLTGLSLKPREALANGLHQLRMHESLVLIGTPSVTDFKPRIGWKEIRRWLESMQLIAAA